MTRPPLIDRVFIDMDGVLFDFIGPACRAFGMPERAAAWPAGVTSLEQVFDVTTEYLWSVLDRAEFWSSLPKLPWCDSLIAAINTRCQWWICSNDRASPICSYAKQYAIRHKIATLINDSNFDRVHLTPWKHHLAGKGALLIDDHDDNVERFRKAGGHAVLFPQPWNSRAKNSGKVTFQEFLFQLDESFRFVKPGDE